MGDGAGWDPWKVLNYRGWVHECMMLDYSGWGP